MKKIAPALLVLALAAGCKKKGPKVPSAFADMVPTRGLSFASEDDPMYTGKNERSATLIYDGLDADSLRGAFAHKLAALDGFRIVLDCGADDGFSLAAVKEPHDSVMVNMGRLGDTSFRGGISVGPANSLTLPPDEACGWTATASEVCDFAEDPRTCVLTARR